MQSYLEGPSYSAVFVGNGQETTLLGITRQLVGEPWLHAGPFRYCGSIGPVDFPHETWQVFQKIGTVLSKEFALRGLFGVDVILHDGVPYVVEVNPRYTASVEILEHALGIAALQLHAQIFDKSLPNFHAAQPVRTFLGKGILFAPAGLVFPASGPWSQQRESSLDPWRLPDYADIPHPGSRIEVGHPVLTFFVQGHNEQECQQRLRQGAKEQDQVFFRVD